MNFFYRCDNCKSFVLFGNREANGKMFCSYACFLAHVGVPSFCPDCSAITTNEQFSDYIKLNRSWIMDTYLGGSSEKCRKCRSVIKTLWNSLKGIPLSPKASFRLLELEEGIHAGFRLPNLYQYHIWHVLAVYASVFFGIVLTGFFLTDRPEFIIGVTIAFTLTTNFLMGRWPPKFKK